jgi:excisionase family DNA binding protein
VSSDLLIEALRPLVAEITGPLEERIAELERQLDAGGPRRWLTLEEAGQRLGCSPAAVRMRVTRGRLVVRRHGRRVYVSRESVDRLA